MSKAEALRQASIALLRTDKYTHPFYWDGFVVGPRIAVDPIILRLAAIEGWGAPV